ncbi:MAG: penicillin-binding transpeptidase domain-containing protein [Oscillospiraceae bacterium]|nr:penicillin-binding transpeptidase domain-containing protein [Oscillospiraceae bacterium]
MKKQRIRIVLIFVMVLTLFIMSGVRLMQIQVVESAEHLENAQKRIASHKTIKPARGEILDRYGNPLVVNKIGFNVVLERAFLAKGTENDTIVKLLGILEKASEKWEDNLPISEKAPYKFEKERGEDIEKMKSRLSLNTYATVENCIDYMKSLFDLDHVKNPELLRKIIGVRYEMLAREFSIHNSYTFAEDVSVETVAKIQELKYDMPGVDISETTHREYVSGKAAPHIIGTIGPIYAEEWAEKKKLDYKMDDYIGKSGIELAMEDELRGKNGTREVVQNQRGEVLSVKTIQEPVPGRNVIITIDKQFQLELQKALEDQIKWNRSSTKYGYNAKGGACAVVSVKTGDVLALANFPSYDINDYKQNYSKLLKEKDNPLFDRCLMGLYRPGSTFKSLILASALNEGSVGTGFGVSCRGGLTLGGHRFRCEGSHGNIGLASGLTKSCNVLFYEAGRKLGINNIVKYGNAYGLGIPLELELRHKAGNVSAAEHKPDSETWNEGDLIQTAIGQSENYFTPLSMAVMTAALANEGVRYETHIIKSVQEYDYSDTVKENKPTVADKIPLSESAMNILRKGMEDVSGTTYGAGGEFSLVNLGYKVGSKTGTPQVSKTRFNSAIIAYWPTHDPEIAMYGILEDGDAAKALIRRVINAYEKSQKRSYTKPQPAGKLLP